MLGDLGCHLLDLTTAVGGDVQRLRCSMHTFPKIAADGSEYSTFKGTPLDGDDTALIELDFVGGGTAVAQTTRWATGRGNSIRLEAHGTTGALRFDLDQSYERIETCTGADLGKGVWQATELPVSPNIWQRFVASIQSGTADQPDLQRGAQVQAYLDAAQRSARSGTWEMINSWS